MNRKQILSECDFKTSRSSGAGGQHVNKTETKVSLTFYPGSSKGLTALEKARIFKSLGKEEDWVIRLHSQKHRSQSMNKDAVVKRLFQLLEKAVKPLKKRKKTGPLKADKEKRLNSKRHRSEIKKLRKPPKGDY